jgi:hypothetical protein
LRSNTRYRNLCSRRVGCTNTVPLQIAPFRRRDRVCAPHALTLLDDLRLERPAAIAWHLELDLADLGQHPLRTGAVPRVAPVAALGRVLGVAEMVLHLHLERGLEHRLRQIAQQTARTNKLSTLAPRASDQLLREQLIHRRLPGRRHLLRDYELPSTSHPAGKSGPRSDTVSRTVPRDTNNGALHAHGSFSFHRGRSRRRPERGLGKPRMRVGRVLDVLFRR